MKYSDKLMLALFCANLVMLGVSTAAHNYVNMALFALGVFGTSPIMQKQRWVRFFCQPPMT